MGPGRAAPPPVFDGPAAGQAAAAGAGPGAAGEVGRSIQGAEGDCGADAAYEQLLRLTYMPLGTTTEPTIKLAEKISQIAPGDMTRSFFTSGGSEAVETALKLTRAYFKRVGEPNRTKFISRKGSYHGATMGALALGGSHLYPKLDYEPLMPGVFHVPQPLP